MLWGGIHDMALEQDVNLIYFAGRQIGTPDPQQAIFNPIYDLIKPACCDGIIVAGLIMTYLSAEERVQWLHSFSHLPIVSIGAQIPLTTVTQLQVDNVQGVYDIVVHLIQVHKKQRIAFIQGSGVQTESMERYQGYLKALADHDIPFDPALVTTGDWQVASGRRAVQHLWRETDQAPDAIVAANDHMALGAVEMLTKLGIAIGDAVAVVGFDNTTEAQVSLPAITTVEQPIYQLGNRAVALLLGADCRPHNARSQSIANDTCYPCFLWLLGYKYPVSDFYFIRSNCYRDTALGFTQENPRRKNCTRRARLIVE